MQIDLFPIELFSSITMLLKVSKYIFLVNFMVLSVIEDQEILDKKLAELKEKLKQEKRSANKKNADSSSSSRKVPTKRGLERPPKTNAKVSVKSEKKKFKFETYSFRLAFSCLLTQSTRNFKCPIKN